VAGLTVARLRRRQAEYRLTVHSLYMKSKSKGATLWLPTEGNKQKKSLSATANLEAGAPDECACPHAGESLTAGGSSCSRAVGGFLIWFSF